MILVVYDADTGDVIGRVTLSRPTPETLAMYPNSVEITAKDADTKPELWGRVLRLPTGVRMIIPRPGHLDPRRALIP